MLNKTGSTTGKSTSLIMIAGQNKILYCNPKIHLKLKTDILMINDVVLNVKAKRMAVT